MSEILYMDKLTKIELTNGNIIKYKDTVSLTEIIAQKKANKIGLSPRIYTYGIGYIEMEYIKGLTLDQYLRTNGDRSDLRHKLINTLTLLYDNGIQHRDLTGKNIIITPEGDIKIIDFEHSIIHNEPVPKNKRDFGITKNF
jgi:predicted Ser/Thr protein kinase